MSNPRTALDYPNLNDHVWIIWSGNEFKWPDARRQTAYLSTAKTDALHGHALFTPYAYDAATFASEDAAREFLTKNEELRGHPYGVQVTTVADLKRERGYA